MRTRKTGEGAEAQIFETGMFGTRVIAKIRQPKAYRIAALDRELRRGRTRKEARAMLRARNSGVNVPALLALGEYSIYMEKVGGRLLKDTKPGTQTYAKIGGELAKMHRADIAHGDFTPANILLDNGNVCVIDFGLAEITKSVEEKALDLLLMKRAAGREEFGALLGSYSKEYAGSKQVLDRLAEIERRGRYQTRTLA
jgi:N6-L-threonylcarbamoyladenine synthase/protein kinase Bud32